MEKTRPKYSVLTMPCTKAEKRDIERLARENKQSVSALACTAIRQFCDQFENGRVRWTFTVTLDELTADQLREFLRGVRRSHARSDDQRSRRDCQ